jgi:peptidoglycan-associated lipoprotein
MRLFFVLLLGVILSACSVEKKATKAFLLGKYQNAIDLNKKMLASNPNNGKANYFVAESYRLSNRLAEAEAYYAKAKGRGIDPDSVKFFYAQALKSNGQYDKAKSTLEELIKETPNSLLKDRANIELNGLSYLEDLNSKPSFYKVKNLELINTPASEYSPVYLNGELYFTSSRGSGKIYEAEGKPFTDLYKVTTRGANVDMTTLTKLPAGINEEMRNEGSVTFTPDGKTMVFAKGNSAKKKGGGADVDLYISRFRNNEWSEPVPININTQYKNEFDEDARNYSWDGSPAFSPDGRTLYFASNRKGGYGGTDLYSATMDSRGRFTRVKNLGPEINTPGNEMFPHVAEDAKLYFSSDGHPGYGGLDIFVLKRVNGKNVIENLGQPINSTADDCGIHLFRPDRGFFSSNRSDGKGDDDIYTFVNEDPNLKVINYYLQGITYTTNIEGKKQVLGNTRVSLLDANGELMQEYNTGNDGKFLFRVYENEDYNLVVGADGYIVKRQPYSMKGKSVDPSTLKDLITNITLDTTIVLDRIELNKIFVLENIYYDFNKYNIRPDAAVELDKLVQLLIDNPEFKIELSSHTDSIDDASYNLWLSQQRAESAVKYIVERGIAPERLVAKGYGEDFPIARNTNPDGTDNPEGRQKNRRTEFKILEIFNIPKSLDIPVEEEFEDDKYFRD